MLGAGCMLFLGGPSILVASSKNPVIAMRTTLFSA